MTTPIAHEVNRRRRGPHRHPRTIAAALAFELRRGANGAAANADGEIVWPSARYRKDPIGFFRDILGVEPWSKQIEMIEMVRDYPRVAIASGQKISKSHTAAGIALWYYSSFEDARVVMSSTTSRQVDAILWRELRMMSYRSGRCVACKKADPDGRKIPRPCPHSAIIDGELRDLARSGLKAPDFREVVGFTAREAEAVAGISGKNLLYLVDEASGVPDLIFEAMEGNRAGGARIVLFSNPTKCDGEFFEAFHAKAAFYKTMRLSSEDSPNFVAKRVVIPGLAEYPWIEEKRQEWGEDSFQFRVRIKGEFVLNEGRRAISLHLIAEAEKRWPAADDTGRLCVGLDPAGEGVDGDESAFALRRGKKILEVIAMRGVDIPGLERNLLGFLASHKRKGDTEVPVVIVDSDGPIGSHLLGNLRAYAEAHPEAFEVYGVKASNWARRQAADYERIRDELWANLHDWLQRDEGAIPEDTKLSKELHAPAWIDLNNGKRKITPKRELAKSLGRSPDRADAVALSVWRPWPANFDTVKAPPAPMPEPEESRAIGIDPYGGVDWSHGRR